jgi:hypothetical protein
MSNAAPTTKRLWLWMALLVALLIGLAGGILRGSAGGDLVDAVFAGGKAFSTAATLCLAVLTAVRSR